MMSGRLVKAVAASVVPLAVLQGCGEGKKPEPEPTPDSKTETGTTTPPATELATDISSLVENEFKNRDRKNVTEFFSTVLKDKIKIVEDGVIAEALPTKITLNVLAHHHDGTAGDFHAIEEMYSIKELRDIWVTSNDKPLEMPAASITQGFRETFVVNRGDIYLANPVNTADQRASAGIFFKYDGEGPLKGEDGNSRKTFGDTERREEDKVALPMVIISHEKACAHNMLYNYGLAVITVRDLGMSTCFKAAFNTFKIVTMVIAEARAREAKSLSYEEDNRKSFNLYKQGDGANEEYNDWAYYTTTDDNPPKGLKEAKCGANVRSFSDGKREEHLKAGFESLYRNVRKAKKRLVELKNASATQMTPGGLEDKIESINLCTAKEDDLKRYKAYAGDDDVDSWSRTGDNSADELAGGYAKIFRAPKALYWKLSAYAHNAMVYAQLRENSWVNSHLNQRDQSLFDPVTDDQLNNFKGDEASTPALMKEEPLAMDEDFHRDLRWLKSYGLTTADLQSPAIVTVMLDVAMHHDKVLFNMMDEVAEVFHDIYSLSDQDDVKNIPKQALFAPFFCWVGTGFDNVDVIPRGQTWAHSYPKGLPMKQSEVEFLKWRDSLDDEHPAKQAIEVGKKANPYASRVPKFLFDIISGMDDTDIEEKFPYFTHKEYAKKQKELGLKVKLIRANESSIYTTVPESIYWSAPAKTENVAVAMFLGMIKAFYEEYSESDKSHIFFLGKAADKGKNINDLHQQRKFQSKDKDNKKNIPLQIILANKEGGADWEKVKEAAVAAIGLGEQA